ncbi:hypothetical protein HBN50_14450 [Halobacteriovorax sp. GB3]|uniref:hypothetical protein n=1 Tax=Halobacteriovorax sp. GB3 TaxID=2719615 RepID=UPI0023616790|nr:hypothetical protein [Halobacteriovorax sp. GB3]MDD0854310.1 hypothetical protein [Halobacteriovorax sp. GB3]
MMKFLATLLMFISLQAQAFISLDISLVHKKGIDKGLVLVSELHTREDIRPEHRRIVTTKGGIRFEFTSYLLPHSIEEGPSLQIGLEGVLIHSDGRLIKKFQKGDLVFNLEEIKSFDFEQIEGELVNLEIKADLQ